jgi:hypothetical protein
MVFRTLTAVTRDFPATVTAESLGTYSTPSFLQHDWGTPYRLSTGFSTTVSRSTFDGEEDRSAGTVRPTRQGTSSHQSLTHEEALHRRMMQRGMMRPEHTPIPIYSDQAVISTLVTGGVRVDATDFKRFFVGQYVAFLPKKTELLDVGTATYNSSLGIITTIVGDAIGFTLLFGTAPQVTWIALPCFQGLQTRTTSSNLETSTIGEWRMTMEEHVGSGSVLPAVQNSEDVSALGFDYFDTGETGYSNLPILHEGHNWASPAPVGTNRDSTSFKSGLAAVRRVEGSSPRKLETCIDLHLGRESYWNLMRFFESRLGRMRPFLYVSHETYWLSHNDFPGAPGHAAAWTGTDTTVLMKDIGYEESLRSQFYGLYFLYADKTGFFRRWTLLSPAISGFIAPQFSQAMPAFDLDNPVVAVLPVTRARFAKDTIDEEWITSTIVNSKLHIQGIGRSRDRSF